MFYTEIQNRIQFERCLAITSTMEREFLFDCGSTDENPKIYSTTEFRTTKGLPISDRISRCVGVNTSKEITLQSKLFELPDQNPKSPLHTMHFYHWLANNKGSLATGNILSDKKNYLDSLGFVRGQHKLSQDDIYLLKFCLQAFWEKELGLNKATTSLKAVEPSTKTTTNTASVSFNKELSMLACDGDKMTLPKEELTQYVKIKSTLEKAGGKYVRGSFVFKGKVAQDIQDALLGGEKLNDKKKFQFFETTPPLVKKAVIKLNLTPSDSWLEPSAGKAALANAANAISKNGTVVELMPDNAKSLREQGYNPIESDFLSLTSEGLGLFDKILANPPFTNNQDIDHIKKMYTEHLAVGGRLVSFASQSWLTGSTKKQVAFREWLDALGAEIEKIDAGEFKASGTTVATTMITINKLANAHQESVAA